MLRRELLATRYRPDDRKFLEFHRLLVKFSFQTLQSDRSWDEGESMQWPCSHEVRQGISLELMESKGKPKFLDFAAKSLRGWLAPLASASSTEHLRHPHPPSFLLLGPGHRHHPCLYLASRGRRRTNPSVHLRAWSSESQRCDHQRPQPMRRGQSILPNLVRRPAFGYYRQ